MTAVFCDICGEEIIKRDYQIIKSSVLSFHFKDVCKTCQDAYDVVNEKQMILTHMRQVGRVKSSPICRDSSEYKEPL